MKHNKQEIEQIVKKLLNDLEEPYRKEEEIDISYEESIEIPGGKTLIHGWEIGVPTDDYQFEHPDGGVILIYIDDNTGEVEGYLAGPGRPMLLAAKKDETGTYKLVGANK